MGRHYARIVAAMARGRGRIRLEAIAKTLQIFANKAWPVEVVSAKESKGVEEAFLRRAREMLALETAGK